MNVWRVRFSEERVSKHSGIFKHKSQEENAAEIRIEWWE